MIRECRTEDFKAIFEIINDAARAYEGVIPEDCYHLPYMSEEALKNEIESGIVFYGFEEEVKLIGVMGIQDVLDVTLIRHAYVVTERRNKGIGSNLLRFLKKKTDNPVLVGTWADAEWAINFYRKHGFELVSTEEKDMLLRKYWNIPDRQIDMSVVLVDERYLLRRRS
jgi:GNAT superfamily N-acetyltransferase